jgi:hypothetical protein
MMKIRFIRTRQTSISERRSSEGTIVARAEANCPDCDSGFDSKDIYAPEFTWNQYIIIRFADWAKCFGQNEIHSWQSPRAVAWFWNVKGGKQRNQGNVE